MSEKEGKNVQTPKKEGKYVQKPKKEGKNVQTPKKEGKIVRPPKQVELTVYWPRLVTRPNCVDRLSITLGSKVAMVFTDPSDAAVG